MGSVSVSSCRCCMFVSCVHPVAVNQEMSATPSQQGKPLRRMKETLLGKVDGGPCYGTEWPFHL